MDQNKTLVFTSKEQELEHLNEFKGVYVTYLENKKQEMKKIDKKEEEIEELKDKINFYSSPERYYGKKTDGFDTLRAFCKGLIGVLITAMVITHFSFLILLSMGAGKENPWEAILELIVPIVIVAVLFVGEIVVLAVSIFVIAFFTRKFRVKRKFKRDKSTREVNIQSLNAEIDKARVAIQEAEKRIIELENEFYSVPTILHISDYEYVEYIIYLYEAGRADSLKQAVIILDQEKRNMELLVKMQEINYMIQEAANAISSHVSGAINSMSYKISKELEISRNQMRNQMNAMNAQLAVSNSLAASQLSKLRDINRNTANISYNTAGIGTQLSQGVKVYGGYGY